MTEPPGGPVGGASAGFRRMLLEAARSERTVTYGRLMKSFGLSRGRQITRMIGRVDSAEYASGAPGFAALIVRKDTGFPGGGYFCDDQLPPKLVRDSSRSADPRLSPAEKRHVLRQQKVVWDYYGRRKPFRRVRPTT